jgi:preprotein translocase subunit YajC
MLYLVTFLSLISENAFAQAAAGAGAGGTPNMLMQAFPFIALFAIFYFFMIRPQAKKQKLQQAYLAGLQKGDEVLTSSGIFGTIEGLTDKFVTLEIADDVKIRVLRSQIHSAAKEV